jgi:glucosyl-3-phosphoglycerate synthase
VFVDAAAAVGPAGIVQVDLGTRVHRNRTLDELGPQALTVLQTALDRSGVRFANPSTLCRPGGPPLVRAFAELPPLATLPPRPSEPATTDAPARVASLTA